jgi:hypothetical protein
MALHAADAADRVSQLTTLTERLTGLMTENLAELEARRPMDGAKRLARAEELGRLANIYRHESARVRRDPSLVAAAPDADRARLKTATVVFDATLTRHAHAVEAARSISEGLVRAIAEEVAAGRPAASGYGPRARRPDAAPLAFNRQT